MHVKREFCDVLFFSVSVLFGSRRGTWVNAIEELGLTLLTRFFY